MRTRRVIQVLTASLFAFAGALAFAQEAVVQGGAASAPQAGEEQAAAASGASWWDGDPWSNPDRGFNWYPPPKKPKPKAKPPEKVEEKAVAEKPKSYRDIRDLDELQKELKRLKSIAIFDPTPQNVHIYLQANEYVMSKSQLFADTARRVVWSNPDVDFTSKSPQANYSLLNQKSRANERRYSTMANVAKNHGLVFFFKSDCPYCHDMAPIMKAMEAQYGIEVLPISLDGRGIAEFPSPRPDNGISRFVSNGEGVTTVPAVYLVSNDKKTVMLVGTGALAMDEVAERVRVLTTTKPGEDY